MMVDVMVKNCKLQITNYKKWERALFLHIFKYHQSTGDWLLATAEGIEAPAVLLLIMAKHVDVSIARLNPEILG